MPVSRKKACRACRLAKTRCSLTLPCARCEDKGLQCDYKGNAIPGQSAHRTRNSALVSCSDVATTGHGFLNGACRGQEGHEKDTIGFGFLGSGHCLTDTAESTNMSWDVSRPRFMGSPVFDMLDLETIYPEQTIQGPIDTETSLFPSSSGSTLLSRLSPGLILSADSEIMTIRDNKLMASPATAPLRGNDQLTTGFNSLRLLYPRSMATPDSSLTAKVLIGQLLSYPRMLVSGYRLPPFIHAPCAMSGCAVDCLPNAPHQCFPEILAVCVGLLHMFFTRMPGNCAFALEQIYMHQRRLHAEYQDYDIKMLVEALQVLAIYILLLAENTESIDEENIQDLIVTTVDVATRLQISYNLKSRQHAKQLLNRQDWVLLESGRRTNCILYGIELLLVAEISGNPRGLEGECTGFLGMPLPCGRELWEPVGDSEWKKRYSQGIEDKDCGSTSGLTIADLIHSRKSSAPEQGSTSWLTSCGAEKRIGRWCSKVDEFGTLLWMAVGMAQI